MTDLVERLAQGQSNSSRTPGVPYCGSLLGNGGGAQIFCHVDHGLVRGLCSSLVPIQPDALPSAPIQGYATRAA